MNPKINNFEYTFCVCFVLHLFSFVDGFGVDLGANLVSNQHACRGRSCNLIVRVLKYVPLPTGEHAGNNNVKGVAEINLQRKE